jgi:mannose-6-phosphate isomerase-like protein (cupin superfamily)
MKHALFVVALASLPLCAEAQTPLAPPPKAAPPTAPSLPAVYLSAQELAQRMARAETMESAGAPDTGPYGLMRQSPITVTMEYRHKAAGHASIHTDNAELFVVLDGSGTMSVGGTLVGPHQNGRDFSAARSEGGTPYKLKKGDILLVPAKAAHEVTQVEGKIAMMSVHIPIGPDELWPNNLR